MREEHNDSEFKHVLQPRLSQSLPDLSHVFSRMWAACDGRTRWDGTRLSPTRQRLELKATVFGCVTSLLQRMKKQSVLPLDTPPLPPPSFSQLSAFKLQNDVLHSRVPMTCAARRVGYISVELIVTFTSYLF